MRLRCGARVAAAMPDAMIRRYASRLSGTRYPESGFAATVAVVDPGGLTVAFPLIQTQIGGAQRAGKELCFVVSQLDSAGFYSSQKRTNNAETLQIRRCSVSTSPASFGWMSRICSESWPAPPERPASIGW